MSLITSSCPAPGHMLVVREDGTRTLGCDESSGWIWQAARALDAFLVAENIDVEGLSILELGAGTGWLALQLACRGARVTATDRRGALPLLIRNVISNQERMTAWDMELDIECQCLAWGASAEDEVVQNRVLPGHWDLIIGSDILYLAENYDSLLQLLARHQFKQCIFAFEERKPLEEATFLDMARVLGFAVQVHPVGVNQVTNGPIFVLSMTYARP